MRSRPSTPSSTRPRSAGSASSVRFRTPETVDRPAAAHAAAYAAAHADLSPDLCVVGKDAPKRAARGFTNKGGKIAGKRQPGSSGSRRPAEVQRTLPRLGEPSERAQTLTPLTPDRVGTLLESLGITANSALVNRVLDEIQNADRVTDRGPDSQALESTQDLETAAAAQETHLAPRACPSADSRDRRGRVPGVLEEVLGDFGNEFQPLPSVASPTSPTSSPLQSPEAVLARLRSIRLRRRLGIADFQKLGDVSGDGRLTCAELGKVLRTVGILADDNLVQDVFDQIDRNGNGKISLFELFQAMKPSSSEILAALNDVKDRKHVSLSTLFRPYDSNGDDKLTPGEFHHMLNDLGFELDDGAARELLSVIVRDQDRPLDGGNLLPLRDLSLALQRAGQPDLPGRLSKGGATCATMEASLASPANSPAMPAIMTSVSDGAPSCPSPDRASQSSPRPRRPDTVPEFVSGLATGPAASVVPESCAVQNNSMQMLMHEPQIPPEFGKSVAGPDGQQAIQAPCGLPLGSQAWEGLNRIFYRLAQQSREVSTAELILAIRSDVHVRNEGLLHRPVIATEEGSIPAVSLDAALQQISEQVQQGIGHLDTVTWDRFYWLLLEAHRHRAVRAAPPQRPPTRPTLPSTSPNPGIKTAMMPENCPVDPDAAPAASIEWMTRECSCNHEMLYRLLEMFTYCRGTDLTHVRRDRFIHAVQSGTLYSALVTTPLLSGCSGIVRPMHWGDVLWQLSRAQAPIISWSDVVAAVCWCRAWSLGLPTSSGSSGPPQEMQSPPSPRSNSAVSVSAAKARLDTLLQNRAVKSAGTAEKPSPLPSTSALRDLRAFAPAEASEHLQGDSSLETVSRRLAQASGSVLPSRTHRSRHPWLDGSDDDVPSRAPVTRAPGSVSRPSGPAPEVPQLSPRRVVREAQPPVAALRLQVNADARLPDPADLEKLEVELARILNMPVQAVKLQGVRPL